MITTNVRVSLVVAAVTCLACSKSPVADKSAAKDPAQAAALPGTEGEELKLEIANREKLSELLAANHGKVVLVDYWSTSCVPCVEKLPEVFKLQKRLQDRSFQVITVSMDDPDARDEILSFLKERGAEGQQLISEFGASPQSLEEFEIDLVPHYRLYNRAGELVETFEPGPDAPPLEFSNIEATVERLL